MVDYIISWAFYLCRKTLLYVVMDYNCQILLPVEGKLHCYPIFIFRMEEEKFREVNSYNIKGKEKKQIRFLIVTLQVSMQVYPGGWTASLVYLDNVGAWNLRAENLDRWYLGQETYIRIINPEETNKTELPPPDNVRYCGSLSYLQKYISLTFLQILLVCFFFIYFSSQ